MAEISVIIPIFNEGSQLKKNLSIIREYLIQSKVDYQFILVDDGSKDETWSIIGQVKIEIPEITALRFSRNFGKEAALCAGLEIAKGDACIVIDADLQHPPELIPEMIRLWREGYEIVEGVKASRGKEKLSNKILAGLFYRILQKSAGIDLNRASDFKLLDAKVLTAWRLLPERHTFFRGMVIWVGFKRISIPFVVAERTSGKSKWSKIRLFGLAINAITSFSSLPLQLVTLLGVIFLIGAIPLGIETFYMKFRGYAVSGFTTVILLLLIIGSVLMISLGIIGTYIAKIYEEVKQRPRYLIAEALESSDFKLEGKE